MSRTEPTPEHIMNCDVLASNGDLEYVDDLMERIIAPTYGDYVRHSTLVGTQTGASIAFSEYWPGDTPELGGTAITIMNDAMRDTIFVQTFNNKHEPEWPQYANRQTALDAANMAEALLGIDGLDDLRRDLLIHMYEMASSIGKGREPSNLGTLSVNSSLGTYPVGAAVKKVVTSMMSSSIYTRDYSLTTDDTFLRLQERSILIGPGTKVLRDSPVLQLLLRKGPEGLTFRYLKSMLGKRASLVQPNSNPGSRGLLEELPDSSDPKMLHLEAIIDELINISIRDNDKLFSENPPV